MGRRPGNHTGAAFKNALLKGQLPEKTEGGTWFFKKGRGVYQYLVFHGFN